MSYDPYHQIQAGQARHTALMLEKHGHTLEYPAHGGRSWLRWAWRRLRVAGRAYRIWALASHASRLHTVSITIEIKYK